MKTECFIVEANRAFCVHPAAEAMSEFGVICLCRNFVIMCLLALGVCSVCRMLLRLVASLARASARSLPLIFVWLRTQCRVVCLVLPALPQLVTDAKHFTWIGLLCGPNA